MYFHVFCTRKRYLHCKTLHALYIYRRRTAREDGQAGVGGGHPRRDCDRTAAAAITRPLARGPEERVVRGVHHLPRLAAWAAAAISCAGKGAGVRRLRGTMATAAMSSEGKRRGQERP